MKNTVIVAGLALLVGCAAKQLSRHDPFDLRQPYEREQCPIVSVSTDWRGNTTMWGDSGIIGTGAVIGKDSVITAAHVVYDRVFDSSGNPVVPRYLVMMGGREEPAALIAMSSFGTSDLALLSVNTGSIKPIGYAARMPNIGDRLTWFRFNCRARIDDHVRKIRRQKIVQTEYIADDETLDTTFHYDQELLMFSDSGSMGPGQPGSSGSVILNERGEIVGTMSFTWGGPSLNEHRKFLRRRKK